MKGKVHSVCLGLFLQDTAVALQALAEYGLKFPDAAVADFTVTVPANSPVSSQASVVVNSANYEILQRQPVSYN